MTWTYEYRVVHRDNAATYPSPVFQSEEDVFAHALFLKRRLPHQANITIEQRSVIDGTPRKWEDYRT